MSLKTPEILDKACSAIYLSDGTPFECANIDDAAVAARAIAAEYRASHGLNGVGSRALVARTDAALREHEKRQWILIAVLVGVCVALLFIIASRGAA